MDTSETTDPGACKVESWVSVAGNHDLIGAVNPACGVNLFMPGEFSLQGLRSRSHGDWSTSLTPKAKLKLIPTTIGSWGVAVSATSTYDTITQQNTAVAMTVPATLRMSEVVRINADVGWLWDRTVDRQYLTYGLGVDWRTPDNVFTLTGEIFGQLGAADQSSPIQPRFQLGLRIRPAEAYSMDIIYGRNITGENANWITIGTTIRFAAE